MQPEIIFIPAVLAAIVVILLAVGKTRKDKDKQKDDLDRETDGE